MLYGELSASLAHRRCNRRNCSEHLTLSAPKQENSLYTLYVYVYIIDAHGSVKVHTAEKSNSHHGETAENSRRTR